ncbi:MAG: WD40 repeat domain-containing protein, partial [Planctomycetota bacterium]
ARAVLRETAKDETRVLDETNVRAAALSPSGKLAVLATYDDRVVIVDLSSGRRTTYDAPGAEVQGIAFDPRERTCALAGAKKATIALDGARGLRWIPLETVFSRAVAFDADGTRLAFGSDDGRVRVWDLEKAAEVTPADNPLGPLRAVCLSSRGFPLATVAADGLVHLWQSRTEVQRLESRPFPVKLAALSSDAKALRLVRPDGISRTFLLDAFSYSDFWPGVEVRMSSIAVADWWKGELAADAKYVHYATGDRYNGVLPNLEDAVLVAVTPDGTRGFTWGAHNGRTFWRLPEKEITSYWPHDDVPVHKAAVSPDWKTGATVAGSAVTGWDLLTGAKLGPPLELSRSHGGIALLDVRPGHRMAVAAGDDRAGLYILDLVSGREVAHIETKELAKNPTAIAHLPDGSGFFVTFARGHLLEFTYDR